MNNILKNLLTLRCHYSGRAWARLCKDKTSGTVAAFYKTVITEVGISPTIVQADNGGEFLGQVFVDTVAESGAELVHSTPYHPQSNGGIERFNRITKEMVTFELEQHHHMTYEDALVIALAKYNSKPSTVTGISPMDTWNAALPFHPQYLEANENSISRSQMETALTSQMNVLGKKAKKIARDRKKFEKKLSSRKIIRPGDKVWVKVVKTKAIKTRKEKTQPNKYLGEVVTVAGNRKVKVKFISKYGGPKKELMGEVGSKYYSYSQVQKVTSSITVNEDGDFVEGHDDEEDIPQTQEGTVEPEIEEPPMYEAEFGGAGFSPNGESDNVQNGHNSRKRDRTQRSPEELPSSKIVNTGEDASTAIVDRSKQLKSRKKRRLKSLSFGAPVTLLCKKGGCCFCFSSQYGSWRFLFCGHSGMAQGPPG